MATSNLPVPAHQHEWHGGGDNAHCKVCTRYQCTVVENGVRCLNAAFECKQHDQADGFYTNKQTA